MEPGDEGEADLGTAQAAATSALPPSTIVTDRTLRSARGRLPGVESPRISRPTAVVVDSHGNTAEFVVNELLVSSSNRAAVDAFAARMGGAVVQSSDLRELAAAGVRSSSAVATPATTEVHLVRIDAMRADASRLPERLAALSPEARGDLRVSSDAGVATVAAAAEAAASGMTVGINWIAEGSSFTDGTLTEAPTGLNGFPGGATYSPNPFTWDYLRSGGPTDIGVTQAWRFLALAGKLGAKVNVGVMDGGFNWAGNADMPANGVAASVVPFGAPAEVQNDMACGSNPCPWHGTQVAHVLAGVPDNAFGTAGVAGPVVNRLVTIRTWGDYATMIPGIVIAASQGVRVLNMSLGVPVPAILSFTVAPFEATTALARAGGMLIFAAAGNAGASPGELRNVDDEDCFLGICWESTFHTPCENAGVTCIGGIANNRTLSSGSNFGGEQVLTYAPFTTFAGPTPASPANQANRFSGTSASSPYAAGVAALIWAADTSQSADEVAEVLRSTADLFGFGDARIVDAADAVKSVLGNLAPEVKIVSPSNNTAVPHSTPLTLSAQADDVEDGPSCCTVEWTSNLMGSLGFGKTREVFLTKGTHTIKAKAVDSAGASRTASIVVIASNSPPVPEILKPTAGSTIVQNVPMTLQGRASDAEMGLAMFLPCASMQWSSPQFPGWSATGCDATRTFPSLGPVTLQLKATDSDGEFSTVSRTVNVVAPTPNAPPNVFISNIVDGQGVDHSVAKFLSGGAIDPDGGAIVSFRWTVIRDGVETEIRGPAALPGFSWTPSATLPSHCGGYSLKLRLYATDAQGQVGFTTINIYDFQPVC
ncbi:S8 family serine peptidase [Sorangium sp. So ce887]|uniref:S8 family serine peptidase n=1 Tax=Sorangium sp. So ce887 TaxID=3133324 RepID=UPI003F5E26B6